MGYSPQGHKELDMTEWLHFPCYLGILASWFWCVSCWELFGTWGAIWSFSQLVLTWMMLRIIYEHWLLFGHFCQLVLMSVCCWGPFVNMKCLWAFLPIDADIWPLLRTICKHQCHLGILPIGSDIWLPLRTICVGILTFDYHHGPFIDAPVFLPGESQGRGAWWAAVYRVAQSWTQLKWLSSSSGPFVLGKCLFGTLYWSPLERVYDRSVMWYVALHSICITGTLITLCKMGNSGSVH